MDDPSTGCCVCVCVCVCVRERERERERERLQEHAQLTCVKRTNKQAYTISIMYIMPQASLAINTSH